MDQDTLAPGTADGQGAAASTPEIIIEDAQQTEHEQERRRRDPLLRINKLTARAKSAEEREAALQQQLAREQQERHALAQRLHQLETGYVEQAKTGAQSEVAGAEAALARAQEAGDVAATSSALAKLTAAQARLQQAQGYRASAAPETPNPQAGQPQFSSRVQEWMGDNPWFQKDRAMTDYALKVHESLLRQGIVAESKKYFAAVDEAMRDEFPEHFEGDQQEDEEGTVAAQAAQAPQPQPVRRPPTSGVTRTATPAAATARQPQVVRLTAEEREFARLNNMTDQQYAARKLARIQKGSIR